MELHVAVHSAGSVLMAPLVQLLTTDGLIEAGPEAGMLGLGRRSESLALWVPAPTVALLMDSYPPAIDSGAICRAALFTLTDHTKQADDCAPIYNKSLLYLIAHALEARARDWIRPEHRQGTSLIGMARFVEADPDLGKV